MGNKIGGRCQELHGAGEMRQAHAPLGAILRPVEKKKKKKREGNKMLLLSLGGGH